MIDWSVIRAHVGINVASAKSRREEGVTDVPIELLIKALESCYGMAQQAEKEVTELRERLRREEMKANLFAMYGGARG